MDDFLKCKRPDKLLLALLLQSQQAAAGTAAPYVALLSHLALAQAKLQRDDEALATLTNATDVLTSDLLHDALAALQASEDPRCA